MEAILGTMGAGFLAVLGWAYTLSNRVLIVETEYEGLKDLINAKFESVEERLERIENGMNGVWKGH